MTYSFDKFEFDTVRRTFSRDGEMLALNSKTLDLLAVLLENHGEILGKNELLDKVWEGQFVEENNLTVHVSALRKALGERKGENRFLLTVPGKGYKFVGELNDETNDEIVIENHKIERITIAEETETPLRLPEKKSSKRRMIYALAVLLIATSVFFGFRYFSDVAPAKINSLAVLPFVNETGEADNEYLSDGLAESVIYRLSQSPDLKILSRNSVFRYKGKDTDAKVIGNELNVQAVLIGRVTRRGDSLNVSAELISTTDNSVIWGEQFTRKMSDVEKLQNDIAASISDKLRFKFSGVKPQGTESAEAYQLYLKGLYHWNKRTGEDLKQAAALFQQAIDKDPSYARAYAGLALTYEVLTGNTVMTPVEEDESRLKAKAAAQKALELDSTLAEPHAVLGNEKAESEWDFVGAESHFKRAIELNPNFATAHQWYSELLSILERHDEALSEVKKAYELDPFSSAIRMNVGLRYVAARRDDEAVAQFKKLIDSEPNYPMTYLFLGNIYAEKDLFEEAFEMWCKADVLLKINTPEKCAVSKLEIRDAVKKDGRTGFWRKALEYELEFYEKDIGSATNIAGRYARLGEKERAFEWLEKAFAQREVNLSYLKIDRAFDNVKADPRFGNLLKRIGLPQ